MRLNPLKAQPCTSRGALAQRGGGRDPHKSGKDAMKFRIVTELVNEYLPHLLQADQARSRNTARAAGYRHASWNLRLQCTLLRFAQFNQTAGE